jgi:tRNA 2-thiouridine synthesizing protein A
VSEHSSSPERGPKTAPKTAPETAPEILVDARGHRCPVPTLRLRRAMEAAPPGAQVALLADDPLARIDVPHFLAEAGGELVETVEVNGAIRFLIVKRPYNDVR